MRRQRISHAALQAFNVSKQLVRQEEFADLLPHVERLSRIRKFGRRRLKPAEPPQQQAPSPPANLL
jgi:hypothetical protein